MSGKELPAQSVIKPEESRVKIAMEEPASIGDGDPPPTRPDPPPDSFPLVTPRIPPSHPYDLRGRAVYPVNIAGRMSAPAASDRRHLRKSTTTFTSSRWRSKASRRFVGATRLVMRPASQAGSARRSASLAAW